MEHRTTVFMMRCSNCNLHYSKITKFNASALDLYSFCKNIFTNYALSRSNYVQQIKSVLIVSKELQVLHKVQCYIK